MVGREERVTEHGEEKWQVMDERKTVGQIDARIKNKKKRGRRTAVVRYRGATSLHLTPQEGLAEGRCSGREWTRLLLRQGTANNRKVGHLSCVFICMITADTLTN